MERKLTSRYLEGYISRGLYLLRKDNTVCELCSVDRWDRVTVDRWDLRIGLCDFKMILRHLSDLYRTITHSGKEIVLIVELAKMSLPLGDWIINQNYITDYCFSGQYGNFGFKNGSFWVEDIDTVPNQHELFDYLHELKIDYRGLIDAGLAIDVNTLDKNCYE